MKAIVSLLFAGLLVITACNGSKKTQDSTDTAVPKSTETAEAVQPDPPKVASAPEIPEGSLTPPVPIEIPDYTKKLVDSLYVSIERTPCFGRCPTYKLSVFQSGYATLKVKNWVEGLENGLYSAQVSKEEMDLIREKADAINYYKLPNEFDGPITDIPSTFTAVNFDGRKKSIRDRYDSPDTLREFERFLDTLLLKGKDWKPLVKAED